MRADVAKPRRPQQRIGDRMENDVGIAVAKKAACVGHSDSAKHDRAFAGKASMVKDAPNPHSPPIPMPKSARRMRKMVKLGAHAVSSSITE